MKKKEILITIVIAAIAIIAIFAMNYSRQQNRDQIDAQISASPSSTPSTSPSADSSNNYGMPQETAVGQWVAIIHRNKIVQWFDSGVDASYSLTGDYGEMHVEVADGKWCVDNVECPNHNCEQMGWDDGTSFIPITCIPNNVIICTYDVALNYMENANEG